MQEEMVDEHAAILVRGYAAADLQEAHERSIEWEISGEEPSSCPEAAVESDSP